jgi:hypothetical protein
MLGYHDYVQFVTGRDNIKRKKIIISDFINCLYRLVWMNGFICPKAAPITEFPRISSQISVVSNGRPDQYNNYFLKYL